MPIVFSTLTAANEYTGYRDAPERNIAVREHSVVINGGANVAHKKTIMTPRGVATTVSDADLAFLKTNPVFKMHVLNGFITIDAVKDARDADIAAADMEGRDDSSPDVEQDFADGEAPVVNLDAPVEVPPAPPLTPRRLRK